MTYQILAFSHQYHLNNSQGAIILSRFGKTTHLSFARSKKYTMTFSGDHWSTHFAVFNSGVGPNELNRRFGEWSYSGARSPSVERREGLVTPTHRFGNPGV